MKKPSRILYSVTRKTGRMASRLNDIETILTLNPKKIAKRTVRKKVGKKGFQTLNKFNKKIK